MLTKSAVKKLATTCNDCGSLKSARPRVFSEFLWNIVRSLSMQACQWNVTVARATCDYENKLHLWQVLRKRFWRFCPQAGTPLNSMHCWMSGGGYWLFCTRHSVCKTRFVWLVSKWGSQKKNQRGCSGECQKLCEHVDCYDFLSEIMLSWCSILLLGFDYLCAGGISSGCSFVAVVLYVKVSVDYEFKRINNRFARTLRSTHLMLSILRFLRQWSWSLIDECSLYCHGGSFQIIPTRPANKKILMYALITMFGKPPTGV